MDVVAFKMKTLKLNVIYCLFVLEIKTKVNSEEIRGNITFSMSWDEGADTLTHRVWADVGGGAVDISKTILNKNILEVEYPSGTNSKRMKRSVPSGDYVRHGPSCQLRQLDMMVDDSTKEGQLRIGKAVHVAMMSIEKEEVQMTCHYCDKQDETEPPLATDVNKKIRSQLWYKLSHTLHENLPLYAVTEVQQDMFDDEKRNRVFVTDIHTLVIKNVHPRDSGTYFCRDVTTEDIKMKKLVNSSEVAKILQDDDNLRFLYHLEVIKINDPRTVTMVTTNKDLNTTIPQAKPDVEVVDLNVQVFTTWEEWSPCSSCEQLGTRQRLGVCSVKKIDPSKPSIPWYLNTMLDIYTRGVLCRSTMLHSSNKLRRLVYRPGDEMEEEVCNITCGNFSMKMKDLITSNPGDVQIKVFVLHEGESVALECPKAPQDMPVAWVNGTNVLIRPWLKSQTGGRVSIDDNNTFHVASLQLTDAGHYLCIVGRQILGRVMLGVVPVPQEVLIWRYAWRLMWSYPFDFAVFLMFFCTRHYQRKKVLNYDLLPELEDTSSDSGSTASNINVNRDPGDGSNLMSSALNSNLMIVEEQPISENIGQEKLPL